MKRLILVAIILLNLVVGFFVVRSFGCSTYTQTANQNHEIGFRLYKAISKTSFYLKTLVSDSTVIYTAEVNQTWPSLIFEDKDYQLKIKLESDGTPHPYKKIKELGDINLAKDVVRGLASHIDAWEYFKKKHLSTDCHFYPATELCGGGWLWTDVEGFAPSLICWPQNDVGLQKCDQLVKNLTVIQAPISPPLDSSQPI